MAKSFSERVKARQKASNTRFGRLFYNAGLQLMNGIIKDTPVGNEEDWNISDAQKAYYKSIGYKGGTLRNDWRFKRMGSIKETRDKVDPSASDATGELTQSLSTANADINKGQDTFVTAANNQPYANRIEFAGWSKKSPNGMVRINLTKIRAALRSKGII